MAEQYATIKINIENGECDASVDGHVVDIVEGLAHMLIKSNEMLRFFKAAVEVTELHNNELKKK
ncbi:MULTISPECIES: hypothetical protein [Bizionia]|uniref:Uncharacterized protein n=1 Tax=Bizionia algoritergicola TaxID=291187 RepID=A0A5D0QJU2_9FLAO|nr:MULTISPECIES: hypothetical protein [Bizionia]OBX17748.1 hypothetical protein BAA08_15910 [Bizionia sp. APA-3]OBX17821.1 hypothetical protein BAA08_15815 [Bizionia sp. APA-3]TYB69059.1 hypothetical protein ES675_16280 [Bizionia algoritergicola]TYB69069.1 hypothetical protein ES675_16255 [Bizionia algoritergicola]